MIAGRYEVKATHGKGVFSTVLLARDRSQPEDHPLATVAIKVQILGSHTCDERIQQLDFGVVLWSAAMMHSCFAA